MTEANFDYQSDDYSPLSDQPPAQRPVLVIAPSRQSTQQPKEVTSPQGVEFEADAEVDLGGLIKLEKLCERAGVDGKFIMSPTQVARLIYERLVEKEEVMFCVGEEMDRILIWQGKEECWEEGYKGVDKEIVNRELQELVDEVREVRGVLWKAKAWAKARGRIEDMERYEGYVKGLEGWKGLEEINKRLGGYRVVADVYMLDRPVKVKREELNKVPSQFLVWDKEAKKWRVWDVATGEVTANDKGQFVMHKTLYTIESMEEIKRLVAKGSAYVWKQFEGTEYRRELLGRYFGMGRTAAETQQWIRGWMQLMGYSSVLGNSNQKIVEFVGTPGTGKSTIVNIHKRLLRDGAVTGNIDYFLTIHRKSSSTDFDGVAYESKRAMFLSEPPDGAVLDDSKFKGLVGTGRVRVRGIRQASKEINVTITPFIDCNNPCLWGDSSGAMDRRMIRLNTKATQLKDGEKDSGLEDRIIATESHLILLAASFAYQEFLKAKKFNLPDEAFGDFLQNRLESSPIGDFFEKHIEVVQGWEEMKSPPKVLASDLHQMYVEHWIKEHGGRNFTGYKNQTFNRMVEQASGHIAKKGKSTGNQVYIFGIKLKGRAQIVIDERSEEDYGE